jgi:predicted alpha/beta-hydrolase family hydrolase
VEWTVVSTEELRLPVGGGESVGVTLALPNAKPEPTAVLLAHGAGNDRFAPLLVRVQQRLAGNGVICATFNFLYKERGRRIPDPLPVLMETYRAVVGALRARLAGTVESWVLGGKSLGGRVASHLVAEGQRASGLVFLGYPLHPAGKPEQLRIEHLPRVAVPMLFVQGTRDPLCNLGVLQELLERWQASGTLRAKLAVIEGGDHSLVVPRRLGRSQEDVYEEVARIVRAWLDELAG